jgi:hypothetical protein
MILRWFYELGTAQHRPRGQPPENAQQVTAVERGYKPYEANCARPAQRKVRSGPS